MTEARTIRHSNGCIKEVDMPFLLKKAGKKRLTHTIESDLLGYITKKFVPFEIEHYDRETDKTFIQHILVDATTGSMYDKVTGDCLSSTRLRITDA